MCTEIETKLKVDSHEDIEATLKKLGAKFTEVQFHRDDYFDDARGSFAAGDKCIRLRRQKTDHNQKTFLTYKGPKEKHQVKKRREIELELSNAENAHQIFIALGYKLVLTIEKKRTLWQFNHCDIALDDLPLLGKYLEIEGPDAKTISDVKKSLNLSHLPHINESYACLIEKHSHRKT